MLDSLELEALRDLLLELLKHLEPIQFDGNNIEAPSMYGFDAQDQILDLTA